MDRQLSAIVNDLQSVEQRLRRLHDWLPRDIWRQPPGPGRWSPADCVAHLNLTSNALLPLIRHGLRDARMHGHRPASKYRRNAVGWLLWTLIAPSNGLRTRTIQAHRLPIDRVMVRSPYDARVRCNLYAALTLIPRHQQRHVLQAERAAGVLGAELSPLTA